MLANILGSSNEGPHVFEMRIIPTIEGFVYDNIMIIHTDRHDFALVVETKSQDLMLKPRLLYRIITQNILLKNRHYDEFTFMDLCFIDCMIMRRPINLPCIMIKNLIMANDYK